MPSAAKATLLLILGVVFFAAPQHARAVGQGGVSISPATLTLNLAAGSQQQTAGFTLTNRYDQPITLHFGFEPPAQAPKGVNPAKYLTISYSDITIRAGEATSQTVTLHDSTQLSPGSQLADLVVTQFGAGASNVSIMPSIRLPLVLVKQDGAVSSINLASLKTPFFGLFVPGNATAIFQNTGNMIAIPRGTITITAPDGTVVRRGVLNVSSQAVSPGGKLSLSAPLDRLAHANLPGVYRISVSYGLGGGQKTVVASDWFFYIAWWHLLALAMLGAIIYFVRSHASRLLHKKPSARHRPPVRRILIGRNA